MLELLKERKAALEAQGKKGFTLMEMLIVIAIIAVLIAIAIPIFTSQLENSRDATSVANMRSAYAEAQAAYLAGNAKDDGTVEGNPNIKINKDSGRIASIEVSNVAIETQQANTWSNLATDLPFTAPTDPGTPSKATMVFTYATNGSITVAFKTA